MKDPHVESVAEKCNTIDLPVMVIDYFKKIDIELSVNDKGNVDIIINNNSLRGDVLIWDRVKLNKGMSFYFNDDEERTADLRSKEWRAFYNLICTIYGDNVVNTLKSRYIMIKPFQQIVACSADLNCPDTLVTTSKESAKKLYNKIGTIAMKSLSGGKILPKFEEMKIPYNVNTMKLDIDDIDNSDDIEFKLCPHLLQKYINKHYELRIVIINNDFYAFRINSQEHIYYATDWRRGNQTLEFIPFELPDEIKLKLNDFMNKMNLFSGSVDMIVDNSGKYWFLECNQDGQWAWLDPIVDGAISSGFARAFKQKHDSLQSR